VVFSELHLRTDHKNVLSGCRYNSLLGNQTNCFYVGIQRQIKAVPSVGVVTSGTNPRRLDGASRQFQNNELNRRRGNSITKCENDTIGGNGRRDLQHRVTSSRSKRGDQVVNWSKSYTHKGVFKTQELLPHHFI